MNKKIVSIILAIIMVVSIMPMTFANTTTRKVAEAVYGSPTIDGKIDKIWDSANYYIVNQSLK